MVSETAGSLVKIVNNNIEETYMFEVGDHPQNLVINDARTDLYFSNGSWSKSVYSMKISDTQLPDIPLINRSFYALGFNDGFIYGTDPVDYSQQGWSYRYMANGTIGIVTITGGGSGYTTTPTITFTGLSTVSAAATAIVSTAGTISAIHITNSGARFEPQCYSRKPPNLQYG